MNTAATLRRTAVGAAAGLAGTVLIQGMMMASQTWAPEALPPIRQDPGEFMVETAEENLPQSVRKSIPAGIEKAAAKSRSDTAQPSARSMRRHGRKQEDC